MIEDLEYWVNMFDVNIIDSVGAGLPPGKEFRYCFQSCLWSFFLFIFFFYYAHRTMHINLSFVCDFFFVHDHSWKPQPIWNKFSHMTFI